MSATASIAGSPNPGASYLFSAGDVGSCNSQAAMALDASSGFTGTIAFSNLPAGNYCIGLNANNSNDPPFTLTFNTPVEGQTAAISYSYKGNSFTDCDSNAPPAGAAPCPANWMSDYDIASITLSAPFAGNLSSVNPTTLPSFLAWTIADNQGYASFSSANPGAYQFAFSGFSVTTNGTGALTAWAMDLKTNPYINDTIGAEYIGITSPSFIGGGDGLPLADFLSANGGDGPTGGWNFGSATPGQWTETLNAFQGGTAAAPVFLVSVSPVAGVSGQSPGRASKSFMSFTGRAERSTRRLP